MKNTNCDFVAIGEKPPWILKCRTCGYTTARPVDNLPQRVMRPCELKQPSKGLGDTIAKAAAKIGIKPCGGCKKRKEWLNKLVQYRSS